ncbi:MAG: CAP domain-containing protein [Patescibacteria group bacterium]
MFSFLRHLFVPHHTNNHRPKVLHHQSLFVLVIALCIISVSSTLVRRDYPAVLSITADISAQELLTLTNKEREKEGLTPLRLNDQLSTAATLKADHMFTKNYWAHIAPDGTTPWLFIRNSGYEYLYAGENLARGFTTAPEVVTAWIHSPSHKENMLSPNYNEVGFAIKTGELTGSDTVLVVEMFGTKYIAQEQQPTTLGQTFPTPAIPRVSFEASVNPFNDEQRGAPEIVASLENRPLIDSKSTTRNIALFIFILFIGVLIIDAIVIGRKQVTRIVAHNIDHIIFLTALLIAGILIGKGVIL